MYHTGSFLCPPTWVYFSNSCFLLIMSETGVHWKDAQLKCSEIGANLPALHSEQETGFIHSFGVKYIMEKVDSMIFLGMKFHCYIRVIYIYIYIYFWYNLSIPCIIEITRKKDTPVILHYLITSCNTK